MSDFGAMISVRKKDGGAFSDEEETLVRTAVRELHEAHRHLRNAIGEALIFDTGVTQKLEDPDFYEMNVLLSDYWGDSKDFNDYKDSDLKDTLALSEKLRVKLGEKYVLDPQFEWW